MNVGMQNSSPDIDVRWETDLVVVGSGVAGLTAALCASLRGLSVVVVEHANQIGGTSARSSGTVWIPGNHYLRATDAENDRDQATQYLASLVGARGDKAMWQAFLENGPKMLSDLDRVAGVSFKPYFQAPDYRQDHPGAAAGGRPLEPLPFDGRTLGEEFAQISAPLPELMVFGGMMLTRGEAMELLRADKSPKAFMLGARLVTRYLWDRLHFKRGTRLVLGNALVARLFKAVRDRQVSVLTKVQVSKLIKSGKRVSGVEMEHAGKRTIVEARLGVVLAGGGFPANADWRSKYLPKPTPEYTPAAPGCDGSTIKLGMNAGAAFGPGGLDNASWFPSSIAERTDGAVSVYPHIVLDRAKPGLIAINGAGKRFTNEAVSYHEFVRAMYQEHRTSECMPAWLICDRDFIRKYGLGLIRPRTPSVRKYVSSGYLTQARTLKELAAHIRLPTENLQATVERYNGFATNGIDEDFGKGGNIYDRSNGNASVKPNPCIGPISKPPFYALPVLPTPLGTSRGLRADPHARVCDKSGKPITGLYVCGNDMQSAFGGEYPGAGAQLGQAMTFAWTAVQHIVHNDPNSSGNDESKSQNKNSVRNTSKVKQNGKT